MTQAGAAHTSIATASTPATPGANGHPPSFEDRVAAMSQYLASPRFAGIARLYSPRQVVEQQGSVPTDYPVAREAAEAFYARLRQLFAERRQITTFGPYSPGQAVVIKRLGIEGIYLGGWATSAKGSRDEDPGPDLASYPLSQVPDEAADAGKKQQGQACHSVGGAPHKRVDKRFDLAFHSRRYRQVQ